MTVVAVPRRWSRVAGYAMMAAAGIGAAAVPTPSVQDVTGMWVYLWAGFLAVGGVLAAYGATTDRWIGEYAGLPMLATAFGVYAVVLGSQISPRSMTAALALAAIGLLLYGRWRDVSTVRAEATRHAQHSGG